MTNLILLLFTQQIYAGKYVPLQSTPDQSRNRRDCNNGATLRNLPLHLICDGCMDWMSARCNLVLRHSCLVLRRMHHRDSLVSSFPKFQWTCRENRPMDIFQRCLRAHLTEMNHSCAKTSSQIITNPTEFLYALVHYLRNEASDCVRRLIGRYFEPVWTCHVLRYLQAPTAFCIQCMFLQFRV